LFQVINETGLVAYRAVFGAEVKQWKKVRNAGVLSLHTIADTARACAAQGAVKVGASSVQLHPVDT
jgi:hypothetical protein